MNGEVVLPDNWERIKLRKLVVIDSESLGTKTPSDYEFKYISLSDVNSGVINGNLPLIKFSDAPSRAKRKIRKGDVLFSTVRPNLEGYARINGDENNLIASTGFAVLSPKEITDTDFIYQYLYSYDIKRQIYALVVGSNYPAVNSSDVANLKFSIPKSPSERQTIADLLSTWDEAIEKTERLIKAKEKRFKRLLNDLIHQGRSNHTWKGFNLSDLCSPVSRKNIENNTNVLTSSAQYGLVSQLEYYNKSVSADNVTGYYLLKKGEFAYNRSSAKGYPYGATKRLDRYQKGVLSTLYLCFALRPEAPCESDFLLHLFESGAVNRELRAVCQEGARSHGLLNITKADFFGVKLFLPSQEQQQKIQSALNAAQEEIDLLKELAGKYKAQKRGLMQKLLTGEWRVNTDKEVA